tara:strand:+ start:15494 stop:17386 length:1893 start_codon:yes stop_codon:yes gene_type:complete
MVYIVNFLNKTLIISLFTILCGIMQNAWSLQPPTLSDFSAPSTAKFLPLESAFALSAEKTAPNQVTIDWHIAPEYYLYQEKLKINIYSLQDKTLKKNLNIAENAQASRIIQDPYFGEQAIYENNLMLNIPLEASWLQNDQTLVFEISFQGCAAKGLCYPPNTTRYFAKIKNSQIGYFGKTDVQPLESDIAEAEAPALTPKPQNHSFLSVASLFDGSLLKSLATFYLLGVLLSFTPCVLPMLPILSSVLVGQKNLNTRKAFLLSLCYTLSLSVMLALIGSLAVLMGKNFQALFQQAWIIILFASLFTYLGFVQLGLIHLSLPGSFHDKIHQIQARFPAGSYLNAIIMGALAILIASPCVSAPLVGALSYISQTGDYILGAGALFMLGLGMGTLLTFAGTLGGRYIPKAGNWMHVVNKVFAALFFALSVWLLGRVIPEWIATGLWVLWSFIVAFMLGTFSSWRQLSKDIGMIFFIYGCLLVISIMQGQPHPLQPLRWIFNSTQNLQASLQFEKIDSIVALQTKVQQKSANSAIVKITADWCTSCEHNERAIFMQPEAQAKLNNWSLYKIDVTQMDAEKEKLLKLLNIYGPPVVLFYDQNGQEHAESRIVGEGQLTQFLTAINKVCDSDGNVC